MPCALPSLALLAAGALGTQGPAASELPGEWHGAVYLDGAWSPARLRLSQRGQRLAGEFDLATLGVRGQALEGSLEGDTVRLTLEATGLARCRLVGRLADGILRGDGGAPPAFVFLPAAGAPSPEDALGWYERPDGGRLFLTHGAEGGIRFFGPELSGALLPLGPDRYCMAYVDQAAEPELQEVRFARAEGAVVGLDAVEPGGRATRAATRAADPGLRQEILRFASGDVELRGLLVAPAGPEPRPALVFVQGTGYSTTDRAYEMSLARRLLERGFAVLLFDKRGCGGSSGDWRTASLDELASDVAAAVAALRARPDVAPDAIGLYGISEGGWVAPLAAGPASGVAFLVDQGGPAVSPLEDELDDLTAGIGELGFEGEERELALELARALVDVYRSPDGWPRFQRALERARARPWFAPMSSRIPQSEDDWRLQWWRRRGRLDPDPVWRQLSVPALVVLGERDETMDLPANLERFEALRAHNPRIEVRCVPGADHGLRVGGELAPGVVDDLADWMLDVLAR